MKIKLTYKTPAELAELLRRPLQEYIDEGVELKEVERPASQYKNAYLNLEKRKEPTKT